MSDQSQQFANSELLTEKTGKLILDQMKRQTFALEEIRSWIVKIIWSMGIGGAALLAFAIYLYTSASQ
jgi:hypothetical protein